MIASNVKVSCLNNWNQSLVMGFYYHFNILHMQTHVKKHLRDDEIILLSACQFLSIH